MTMLVTLQQASEHLRRDSAADDNDVTLKIHAASGAVLNYLKSGADRFKDEDGEIVDALVPFEVKAAVLLQLGFLYADRDNDDERQYQPGYLPAPVTALLYPLRDPALA